MEKSEHINELITALSRAQGEFPAVPMNATNKFLGNRYADLGSVIVTVKQILSDHGLSISQLPCSDSSGIGVTTVLAHSSGQWISDVIMIPLSDEKGKSLAQVAGSVITYLRRYAYASILGLYADEDTDGNDPKAGDKKPEVRKPQATVAPRPVAPKTAGNADSGRKDPPEVTADATLITVWNGTQKPAQDLLSAKAAEAFMKSFVTSKDNVGDRLFNSKAYLTNHLRSHFKVDTLQEMTYEKVMACLKHMKKEGDDLRWYAPEPQKDAPVATTATQTAEPATAPAVGADEFTESVVKAWNGKSYADLSPEDKEKVGNAMKLAAMTKTTDAAKIADLLKMD